MKNFPGWTISAGIIIFAASFSCAATLPHTGDSLSNYVINNTPTTHVVSLRTANTAPISKVEMQFSPGFNLSTVTLGTVTGIGTGTVSVSGDTVIYTVTAPDTIGVNTLITIALLNIGNASTVSNTYTVTITTKNSYTLAIIDGPTSTPNFILSDQSTFNASSSYIIFSPYKVSADGISTCTAVVTVNDLSGYPLSNKTVVLATTRPNSDTIRDSTGAINNTQVTDASGQCTFTIVSSYAGGPDTLTAVCEGNTITGGMNKQSAIGLWRFDTDLKDASGYGNNGTMDNTGPIWVSGRSGSGLQFDGTDDYARIPYSAILNSPSTINQLTLEAWAYPIVAVSTKVIFERGANARIYQSSSTLFYFMTTFAGDTQGSSVTTSTAYSVKNWYHIVGTYDGSVMRIYLNGALQTSTTYNKTIASDGSSQIYIGRQLGSDRNFTGIIDEVKMYNRALSETEVKLAYSTRASFYFTATKLKITTSPFSAKVNTSSSAITVQARGNSGGDTDPTFNETITLTSSSSGGRFSLDGVNWSASSDSVITLTGGQRYFYYKDSITGNPIITVSRSGLTSDTQQETIIPVEVSDSFSYITMNKSVLSADGISTSTVSVTIMDMDGAPVSNTAVLLNTTRPDSTIIENTTPGSALTDSNGQCTWTLRSSYAGYDTITISSSGKTIRPIIFKDICAGAWFFDEGTGMTTKDVSSHSNTGTLQYSGSGTYPLWVDGKSGKALKFTTSNTNYLQVADSSSLDQTGTLTVMMWVKTDTNVAPNAYFAPICKKTYLQNGWNLNLTNNTPTSMKPSFNLNYSGSSPGFSGNAYDFTVWRHIAVVFDRGPAKMYVDGNLDAQYTFNTSTIVPNNVNLTIGTDVSRYFSGIIDEVKIFGTALSADEIKAEYLNRAIPIYFSPLRLRFVSPPVNAKVNQVSDTLTVRVEDISGNTFPSNNTITLSTSSSGGQFSSDSVNWSGAGSDSAIYLINGLGRFYYKDSTVGKPVLTISHSGWTGDTQQEQINSGMVGEPTSYIKVNTPTLPADSSTQFVVVVTVKDSYGISISDTSVTLVTTKGNSDIIGPANPQTTDSNGQCTFTLKSSYSGDDTITATSGGITIRENRILNPSFEDSKSYWTENKWYGNTYSYEVNSVHTYSGSLAVQSYCNSGALLVSQVDYLSKGRKSESFKLSVWCYPTAMPAANTVYTYARVTYSSADGGGYEDFTSYVNNALLDQWQYLEKTFTTSSTKRIENIEIVLRIHVSPINHTTVWFDDVRFSRVPTVTFTSVGSKLKIVSSPITTTPGNPSTAITVEAQDLEGNKVSTFNDTVILSSSGTGLFSLSDTTWQDTTVIGLLSGAGAFYYKNNLSGNPVITVSRDGFSPDTQTENILEPIANDTISFITFSETGILADDSSTVYVVVAINDTYGFPITNKSVALQTTRGSSDTIELPNPRNTDANGKCTFTIKSAYAGTCTATATCDSNIISAKRPVTSAWPETTSIWEKLEASSWSSGTLADTYSKEGRYSVKNPTGMTNTNIVHNWTKYNQISLWLYADNASPSNTQAVILNAVSENTETVGGDYYSKIFIVDWSGWRKFTYPFSSFGISRTPLGWHQIDKIELYRSGWGYSNNSSVMLYFDGIVLEEIPNLTFSQIRLKITSSSFSAGAGKVSSPITVEAQKPDGTKLTSSNDTIVLLSSSPTGVFSLNTSPWSDTTIITLSGGSATFYYKDSATGFPVITVYREGFTSDTQIETIFVGASFNETCSYLRITNPEVYANGDSFAYVTVFVKGYNNNPISDTYVILLSARPDSTVIFDTNPANGITNINGQCTWSIKSYYSGEDTFTAVCVNYPDGIIRQNILSNPSFEQDSNADSVPDLWVFNPAPNNVTTFASLVSGGYTAYKSVRIEDDTTTAGIGIEQYNAVLPKTTYKLSCYKKGGVISLYFNWYDTGSQLITPPHAQGITNTNPDQYEYSSYTQTSPDTAVKLQTRTYSYSSNIATVWIDDVRLERIPSVTFIPFASKLKITSSVSVTAGNPSTAITVEAQDFGGNRVTSFSNTISLLSSSPTGKFSIDRINWQDTSTAYLFSGYGVFYYKDSNVGNPIITVYRSGLLPDTQTANILEPSVNEAVSYIAFTPSQILADGISACTAVVTINDTYGFPLVNKLTTLQTARPNSDTIKDSTGAVNNIQSTDGSGRCTFTITSSYLGNDTIVAACDGNTITRGVNKQGAVGIWLLDADVKDISGYGNNGITGGDTSPVWIAGKFGYALQFDGINDYVDCGNNASLNCTQAITIELWAKGEFNKNSWQEFVAKSTSDGLQRSYYLRPQKNIGNIQFILGKDAKTLASNTILNNWEWYHLAGTYDGNVMKIYINGDLDNNSTIGAYTIPTTDTGILAIGRLGSSSNEYFGGIIDEARIYNRALSAEEIKSSYEAKANIYFAPLKLKITSSAFNVAAGKTSPAMNVEAQLPDGTKLTSFNDTITLISSSPAGAFSLNTSPWTNTTVITLSGGSRSFYYKDSTVGSPVITVYRSGFTSDTQAETIFAGGAISEELSYFTVSGISFLANGESVCYVNVNVKDSNYNSVYDTSVTLVTTKGSTDVIGPSNPQNTDMNGQCTFTLKSYYAGYDTITVTCSGKTIRENRFINSSWEDSKTGWSEWSAYGNTFPYEISSERAHSGQYSAKAYLYTGSLSISQSDYKSVGKKSETLKISAWCYSTAMPVANTVYTYGRVWYKISQNQFTDYTVYASNTLLNQWQYIEKVFTTSSDSPVERIDITVRVSLSGNNPTTVWFDDVKFLRVPTVEFNATKVSFASSPFKIKSGLQSPLVKVATGGNSGGIDVTVSGTTATVTSSSESRSFSLNGTSWTSAGSDITININNGEGSFYYKDSKMGYPVLTAYREGLAVGTQTETITASQLTFTSSPFTISSGQISDTIAVAAYDGIGNTDTNWNETVSLSSTSPRGKFSISKTPWSDTTTLKFSSGVLELFYKDKRAGYPVITITSLDLNITQQEVIIMPVITVAKSQKNLRTDQSSTTTLAVTTNDTIEYTITISNIGAETATSIVVADTGAFDTFSNKPVSFIWMDTSTADSWTYAENTQENWKAWGSVPGGGADNVKGLRWKLNILKPDESKNLIFRVKVK